MVSVITVYSSRLMKVLDARKVSGNGRMLIRAETAISIHPVAKRYPRTVTGLLERGVRLCFVYLGVKAIPQNS